MDLNASSMAGAAGSEQQSLRARGRIAAADPAAPVEPALPGDVAAARSAVAEAEADCAPNIALAAKWQLKLESRLDYELGQAIAPLEAMYEGLPVVAFAVDALTESVREGGHLIPPEDYAAFTECIRTCLNQSDEEKTSSRKAARDYVLREYSWSRTGEVYVNILDGA